MHVDLTLFSWFLTLVVLYYLFLFVLGARGIPVPVMAASDRPLVVVVVPARNEEQVIASTVRALLQSRYDGPLRLLVVDDASTDRTAELAGQMATDDGRLRVVPRSPLLAGKGKSEVLNHAYILLSHWQEDADPWLAGYPVDRIVVCILDADGRLSPSALNDATAFFDSPEVGAVQLTVQIRNAKESVLARMQDMEFVGFSCMVQTARDRIGSVALGGNGQFTRLSALDVLGSKPWLTGALTEDLDLGLELIMEGWRIRFCSSAWVDQQGLSRFRPLLRQRTRWIQGHYQCWRLLPELLRSRRLRLTTRLDTATYLLLVSMVMFVTGGVFIQLLGAFGIVTPTNNFLPSLGTGTAFRVIILILSWLPLALTLATYQRYAVSRLAWWECPAYTVLLAGCAYLWAIATLRAWARFALGRRNWVKTPRIATEPGLLVK